MRSLVSALALVPFTALLLGSTAMLGDDEGPATPVDVVAHCDAIADMGTCVGFGSRATAESDCNSYGGTVVDGPCPTEGLVGECVLGDGTVRRYYGGPNGYDADYGSKHCGNAMGGTWTAAE